MRQPSAGPSSFLSSSPLCQTPPKPAFGENLFIKINGPGKPRENLGCLTRGADGRAEVHTRASKLLLPISGGVVTKLEEYRHFWKDSVLALIAALDRCRRAEAQFVEYLFVGV
jgi:hypothetical protein